MIKIDGTQNELLLEFYSLIFTISNFTFTRWKTKNGLEKMLEHISENKLNLFDTIIQDLTRHITVALENIFQPHNASALLRSCDCFGIQDIHIIENNNKFETNRDVALGSSKWLNLMRCNKQENNTLDEC